MVYRVQLTQFCCFRHLHCVPTYSVSCRNFSYRKRANHSLTISTILPRRNFPSDSFFMFILVVMLPLSLLSFFSFSIFVFFPLTQKRYVYTGHHFASPYSALTILLVIFVILHVFSFFVIIIRFLSRRSFCLCYEPLQINP